jgi:hypothetical protein
MVQGCGIAGITLQNTGNNGFMRILPQKSLTPVFCLHRIILGSFQPNVAPVKPHMEDIENDASNYDDQAE